MTNLMEPAQPQTEPLPGTVKLYHRHLIVCTRHPNWTARIEQGGGFLQMLAEAVQDRMAQIGDQVKITACVEAGAGSKGYDILAFPEGVRYVGVEEAGIPALVEDHLVRNRISDRIPHRPLTGYHIFVCIHRQRDERCGVCGPPLITQFNTALAERGLNDQVTVRGSSHIGGHRFAGNVLIYPGGDWYGRVTPADVARILDQHVINGQPVGDLWRGRMGLFPETQLEIAKDWRDG
jgi:hypothetical protein